MNAIAEPVLQLDDIQGNIVPGFLKNHQHFVFFRMDDAARARVWLANLAPRLASAAQVLMAHRLWKEMKQARDGKEPDDLQLILLNGALTAQGLRKVASASDVDKFDDEAFKLGLTAERAQLLGDPVDPSDPGSPGKWLFGGSSGRDVDFVLIAASDDLEWLNAEEDKLIADAGAHGLTFVHRDHGAVRPGDMAGHEPFGFKDGISQPALRGVWPNSSEFVYKRELPDGKDFDPLRIMFARPGQPLVWPGTFIFGYRVQNRDNLELSDDPPAGPEWVANGSFMVYRRLRQDVAGFADFVTQTCKKLASAHPAQEFTEERVGAMLVGRWKSGTPISRSPERDIGLENDAANYFTFSRATTAALPGDSGPLNAQDQRGNVCPLAAHIRKVNPRDDSTDIGPGIRTLQHLLLRRGIPFDETSKNADDQGLLFVCYQSSIVKQFEFLMTDWVNQRDRPRSGAGFDPLLGATPQRSILLRVDDVVEEIRFPSRFVRPTGGAYLFAPGRKFFADLAKDR